jgi:tRNA threonylcarbamoyladenosine biosynthesis protein TsaB
VRILGWDTATAATAVAFVDTGPGGVAVQARHEPAPGERPGHARELLAAVERVLAEAGAGWEDVERLAVGTGPGSFTGLRIGLATARAAALARGLPLAGVGTLRALAAGAEADADPAEPVLAVLDARRGEAFAAAWTRRGRELMAPVALAPERLAERVRALSARPRAVGDGALAFRAPLEAAGAVIPDDGSPLHRVSAAIVCRLAGTARTVDPAAIVPQYLRPPDAELATGSRLAP